jgi:putative SOS response-associated peptidase YedK
MKNRTPFALAGLWENWRHPQGDEWIRTFAIITVPANDLVAQFGSTAPVAALRDHWGWGGTAKSTS